MNYDGKVIAVDFDGNLADDKGEPVMERCDALRCLVENGVDCYILTSSLQPYLQEMSGGFAKKYGYDTLRRNIAVWLNKNVTPHDWYITPVKHHKTDLYLDVNNIGWDDVL